MSHELETETSTPEVSIDTELTAQVPLLNYSPYAPTASFGHRIAYYAIRLVCWLVLIYFYLVGGAMILFSFVGTPHNHYEQYFRFLGPTVLLGATALFIVTKRWIKQLAVRWDIKQRLVHHADSRR